MTWIILTVLAVLARATYSIGTKVLTNRLPVSAGTQTMLLTALAAIFALISSPFLGGISFHGVQNGWLTITIMILSATLGNIAFFQGQRHLEAGTTQIAFSSVLIWGTLLSVLFLGSHFSPLQAIGIVLLLLAIILVQYKKGSLKLKPGVAYIIISAALFASFQVSSANLSKTISTPTYLLLAYGGPAILTTLIYIKTIGSEIIKLTKQFSKTVKALVFAAGTSFLYYVFSYLAYRAAPDRGIVVILLTTQVVVSVILGIVFLRERTHLGRKLSAALLAVAAGILIKS